jgi:hypothetical protein
MQLVEFVKTAFNREFWPIAGKFHTTTLLGKDAWQIRSALTDRPGVYVWCDTSQVLRVFNRSIPVFPLKTSGNYAAV